MPRFVHALAGAGTAVAVLVGVLVASGGLLDEAGCTERAEAELADVRQRVAEVLHLVATEDHTECDSAGTPFVEWPVRTTPNQELMPFADAGWRKVSELSGNERIGLEYETQIDGRGYSVVADSSFIRASRFN